MGLLNLSALALTAERGGLILGVAAGSDGHDKSFPTKAITTIDNFKNALGDTNNR